jgi:SOS-response transcriptional repressor LexA
VLAAKGDQLERWIVPVEGQEMTFRTVGTGGEQVMLKPLNESWQRFAVYFQVAS